MNEEAIFNALEAIRKDISEIRESLANLPRRPPALPPGANTTGKKYKCFSKKLLGGFRDPEIRTTILKLRREGMHYKDIEVYIKEHWPEQPEKHKSQSAIHRFCVDARNGRLREFGIEGIE